MKVTKEQAAEHRAALVRAASRLFRERGIDGVGVADICKAAGLTQGALYAHFPSKGALAAEALAEGLRASNARIAAAGGDEPLRLGHVLDLLVSPKHRDSMATGCALTASASEIARQDEPTSVRAAEGFAGMVALVEQTLRRSLPGSSAADRRARALTIVAAQIGAVALARATKRADRALSDETLAAAHEVLGTLGGESSRVAARALRVRRRAATHDAAGTQPAPRTRQR